MALWVEEATDQIVVAAKEEFLTYGFIDASLRRIAEKANTSPRSIYTRFSSKEGLFAHFVDQHAQYVTDCVKDYLTRFEALSKTEQMEGHTKESGDLSEGLIDYLYDHFDAFYLIICCSKGTIYENWVEELAILETEATYKYMQTISDEIDHLPTVTKDFIHMMSHGFFEGFFEVVRHKFEREQARDYVKKLILFHSGGWEKFLI